MDVAKGYITPDKRYIYVCSKCDGTGRYRNNDCDWCYNLDLDVLRAEIKTARGKRYYALLKAILSRVGKPIVDTANKIHDETGKLTPIDIGYLSLWFDLNFKATCEWLEEAQIIPHGMHDRIRQNVKVGDLYALAREKYGIPSPDDTPDTES